MDDMTISSYIRKKWNRFYDHRLQIVSVNRAYRFTNIMFIDLDDGEGVAYVINSDKLKRM